MNKISFYTTLFTVVISCFAQPIHAQSENKPVTTFAYIKSFYIKNKEQWQTVKPLQMNLKQAGNSYSLDADYVQMLTGKAAIIAAQKNGDADSVFNDQGKFIELEVPNDYYIVNNNPKLRRLIISPTVVLKMEKETIPSSSPKIPVYPIQRLNKVYKDGLFELTIIGDTVVEIKEVYLP